jgi:hypothetical protein
MCCHDFSFSRQISSINSVARLGRLSFAAVGKRIETAGGCLVAEDRVGSRGAPDRDFEQHTILSIARIPSMARIAIGGLLA